MAAEAPPALPLAVEPEPAAAAFLAALGPEDAACKARVFLITCSRILPAALAEGDLQDLEGLTRADVRDAVSDAWQTCLARARKVLTSLSTSRLEKSSGRPLRGLCPGSVDNAL